MCHKHELLDQLANCFDPALTLHLAVLAIFTIATQNMLHASGKYVSSILRFLQTYLNPEQTDILRNYHGEYFADAVNIAKSTINILASFSDLVLKLLTLPAESEEIKSITAQLDAKLAAVKEVASTFKKPGVTAAE